MFNISAEELIKIIENRIDNGDFNDAVHKIKLMTTKEMILEILSK
tara:strand:- start:217 stop:351 length:135 start_codon:yes stop_codon:yes gene_type:complete